MSGVTSCNISYDIDMGKYKNKCRDSYEGCTVCLHWVQIPESHSHDVDNNTRAVSITFGSILDVLKGSTRLRS
jgi:hypothetical protein